ncbi:MAG TPA: DUF2922 domain-containing protein [Syntrophothermus lipocalidus]|mgnify:CR=1 FL=1|uniref:DUF2922 domain-containing protein n=1 Tax=Syntrophothermus lipocalidus (strain DSM 12680 / TGB-C1) TaxID=643648 RepID=D7CMR9_SYNLT|nr:MULTISPECIES: DUF2922 domain-containing protein [Syntrophothermus]ADI02004.1 conserved hypothetical protein [Syntrophothermus lipocalidus DSM 12680]NSW83886.1 DUF2922 domain-containing protein [Syntrophothermus sp.]HHV76688.1 DUF2922 domain-containing protein [Syntrophothermus lipocalidus]HOV42554.1 DUF2922 domain-containing protein [Syntrophothermus lipocalidus]
MAQERTLEMTFANAAGRRVTIRVPDARADLTAAEVDAAMQQIISKGIFTSSGGDLVGQLGARVVTQDTVELEL